MRRDLVLIALIAVAAFGIRVYPAWSAVFGGDRVNFLETDAWYHVRLAENQVRNYPWRLTLDPYAAAGGQFVPIAPLFDTLTSTAVVILHGRDATTAEVERVAAFVPPLLGALTIVLLFVLGRDLFDRRAGLLGAALLAVLPGHFMDRTQLGFVDHHALEACLAIATLLAISRAIRAPAPRPSLTGIAPGIAIGLYLLGWASGAFLLAIIGVWLLLLVPLARTGDDLIRPGRAIAIGALVALALVVLFQDPRMHRYGSQIMGLVGLAAIAFVLQTIPRAGTMLPRASVLVGGLAIVAAIAGALTWWLAPALVGQVLVDIGRLAPDATRMSVLEARPLFLYPGNWYWQQPWDFFRTGFFIGLIALVLFTRRVLRQRRPADLLVWVFVAATFIATFGQNRFGYYLVTACALLGGWLAAAILDWGGVPHAGNPGLKPRARLPLARELAVVIVAAAMFAPNLSPAVLLAERSASMSPYWSDAVSWLGGNTPPPFLQSAGVDDSYYYARYARDQVPLPDYTVMSWWDQGYWIAQRARRVPVANPTQERAGNAARFYVATSEQEALRLVDKERVRFVVSDWELPFRYTADRTIMGRFQNVAEWAGAHHADYYEVAYRRANNAWTTQWIFYEAYYRSMAYRLSVLGGTRASPSNATSVVTLAERQDGRGLRFREVLTLQTYATFDAARQAAAVIAAASPSAQTRIVGLDPWQPAFPLEPLTSFRPVHDARTPEQPVTEAPWVRIFEVHRRTALPLP